MPPSNLRRVSLLLQRKKSDEDHSISVKSSREGSGSFRPKSSRKISEMRPDKAIEPSKAEFLEYLNKLIESVEW